MLHQQAPEIILYCAVGFGTALACAAAAARKTMAFRKAVHWPSVRGKIIKSDAFHCKYGSFCRIRYAFVVGHEITGTTPRLSGNWFWTSTQMDAFVARFPVDQSVEVFYDPENPRRNCLDREDRGGLLPLWVGAALAVICTALLAWGLLAVTPMTP